MKLFIRNLWLLLLFPVVAFAAPSGNEIAFGPAVNEVTVNPNSDFTLPFNLSNTVPCLTFEWIVDTPEGIDVTNVDFGNRLTSAYSVAAQYKKDSRDFVVLAYNTTAQNMMPLGEGLLCNMTFHVGELDFGEYELRIHDGNFNWVDGGLATYDAPDAVVVVKVEPEPELAEFEFSIPEVVVETRAGATFDIAAYLTNRAQSTAFQWWIDAPEGIEVAYDAEEEEYAIDFGSRLTTNYTITADYKKDSHDFLVLGYNTTGKKLMPLGEGKFCTMTFNVGDLAEGEYTIRIHDILFSRIENGVVIEGRPADIDITVKVAAALPIPGDANGDRIIDATDIAYLIGNMLGDTPADFIYDNADINIDDSINATDIARIIEVILGA